MKKEVAAGDLDRRKYVRLRIRPDLGITPQRYEGRSYFVVKDPVSLRYYRFKEQEHFLIELMDGTTTLDQVVATTYNSDAHRALQAQHLYQTYLGRTPTAPEQAAVVQALQSGATERSQVVAILSGKPRCTNKSERVAR